MVLSPATQWWTGSATYTTAGYGGLGTALILWAYQATGRRRMVLSVAAGLSLAAFLTGLYPPWQIGAVLVAGGTALGVVAADASDSRHRREVIRAVAASTAPAALIAIGLFGLFAFQHAEAIEAVTSTVYPGQNAAAVGGVADPVRVLSAPFDSFAARDTYAIVNGTNQSENASGILFVLPVAAAMFAFSVASGKRTPAWFALQGTMAAAGVLAAWTFLPIPAWLGQFALLTRVQPERAVVPLTFASTVAFAQMLAHLRASKESLPLRAVIVSVAVFLVPYGWAAGRYVVDGTATDHRLAAILLLILGSGVAASLARPNRVAGPAVLVMFALWQTSLINPIQRGTDPLTDNALSEAIEQLAEADRSESGWVLFGQNAYVKGILTASGVNHLSAISPYPDVEAWQRLDPSGQFEEVWNRYAHVSFEFAPPDTAPEIRLLGADSLIIAVDPCHPALGELGMDYFVTVDPSWTGCGTAVTPVSLGSTELMIHRR